MATDVLQQPPLEQLVQSGVGEEARLCARPQGPRQTARQGSRQNGRHAVARGDDDDGGGGYDDDGGGGGDDDDVVDNDDYWGLIWSEGLHSCERL